MSAPDFIVFSGGFDSTPMARLLAEAHQALSCDLLERARASGAFARAFLVTDMPELAEKAPHGVVVECRQEAFHFGQRLRELVETHRIQRPFYIGGGAGALLTPEALAEIAGQMGEAEEVVITNNRFSADLVAFAPGSALERIELPATDNPLPRLLQQQAGLPVTALPRATATMFDVDTPADLLILRLHPGAGPHSRRFLQSLSLNEAPLRQAMGLFTEPQAEILVAGRAGSYLWEYLERETACRVRFFAEERGMQAAGRDRPGMARSLLGFYLEAVGVEGFFKTLAELGQAAFLDTRVLFVHLGLQPTVEDRFLSDLGRWQEIEDPVVRQFTQAAMEAPMPVVLGGHSLVAGGLMALVEAAWLEHDALLAGSGVDRG